MSFIEYCTESEEQNGYRCIVYCGNCVTDWELWFTPVPSITGEYIYHITSLEKVKKN